jgi:Ca-activated chloride channel family protein
VLSPPHPSRFSDTLLGLKYNLLTNYTSFVAIDQKVRNVGGKQEVVEQALPMPEGVSDYAVGGGAASGFAGAGKAMRSVTRAYACQTVVECDETKAIPPSPPRRAGSVKVGKVEVSGGMSQKTVKQALEKNLAELGIAYATMLSGQPGLRGKVVVEFSLDPAGSLRGVKVVRNELTPEVEAAVLAYLNKQSIANATAAAVIVTVTFNFTP